MTQAMPSSALVQHWLGRTANEAETVAMDDQMTRARALVADHPAGRGGGLFTVEPAHYEAALRRASKP